MKTIALRFSDNFAPACGTIKAHQQMIDNYGYVWYGKLGTPISNKIADEILNNDDPKILLIHSGQQGRYWAYITETSREIPPLHEIPEYYREMNSKFSCWFKVKAFEEAPKGIMSQCYIASSGNTLSEASRHSMSPYFIITFKEKSS